jgi:hypothetical protein
LAAAVADVGANTRGKSIAEVADELGARLVADGIKLPREVLMWHARDIVEPYWPLLHPIEVIRGMWASRGDSQALTNEAWSIAQARGITPISEGGVDIYRVPMGRNVGYAGGANAGEMAEVSHRTIEIITRGGTNELITAYPGPIGMSMIRASGTCRICQNGELVFSRRSDGAIIVECLECMTGYADPADLERSEILRLDGNDWQTEPTSFAEVEEAGLGVLIAGDGPANGGLLGD